MKEKFVSWSFSKFFKKYSKILSPRFFQSIEVNDCYYGTVANNLDDFTMRLYAFIVYYYRTGG